MNITNRPKTLLILVISIAIAVVVGLMSFGIANQTRAPSRTLALGLYPQGWAKAAFAQDRYSSLQARDPAALPGRALSDLARDALAQEPLAVAAIPVVSAELGLGNQRAASAAILQLGARISRRNTALNNRLIALYLSRGDEAAAILALGRAVAISNDARSSYMRQLAAATTRPGAGEALAPLLGRKPQWASNYWNEVLQLGPAIEEGGKLRLALTEQPWNDRTATPTDLQLVEKLASFDKFDLGSALADRLGLNEPSGSEVLVNGTFNRQPRLAPFDWQLITTGEFGAVINPRDRTMLISSLPQAAGVAARQLVQAPDGSYRFSWTLRGNVTAESTPLRFRLRCAQGSSASAAPVAMRTGSGSALVTLPKPACRWYWAQLEIDTQQSSSGVDLILKSLRLESISPANRDIVREQDPSELLRQER